MIAKDKACMVGAVVTFVLSAGALIDRVLFPEVAQASGEECGYVGYNYIAPWIEFNNYCADPNDWIVAFCTQLASINPDPVGCYSACYVDSYYQLGEDGC